MKKRGFFGGFGSLKEEQEYNKEVVLRIEAERANGSLPKRRGSAFDKFVHDKRGEIDEEALLYNIWGGIVILGIGAMVIGIPLDCVYQAHTDKLNEFVDEQEQQFQVKLENGNVFSINNSELASNDGKNALLIYGVESTENGPVNRIYVANLTKEQYDEVNNIKNDYEKAMKSWNITKKTLNKNKDIVLEYYNRIKEVASTITYDKIDVVKDVEKFNDYMENRT